jgi:hypothetical protein
MRRPKPRAIRITNRHLRRIRRSEAKLHRQAIREANRPFEQKRGWDRWCEDLAIVVAIGAGGAVVGVWVLDRIWPILTH